jgi:aminoglycoside phosphotransferase (APT) family kinase protein
VASDGAAAAADDVPGEPPGVHVSSLRAYLQRHLDDADFGTLHDVALIDGGRSNLTYMLSDGRRQLVLRRGPLGHVLPSAHDMGREFRVVSALAGTGVPVARPLLYCDDAAVIGAPFYVMERVDGTVLRSAAESAALNAEQAEACSRTLVETLVAIHKVDIHAAGLDDLGRARGYVTRQLRRWADQWLRSRTRDLPDIDRLLAVLADVLPPTGLGTLVHGDYRIDNVIFRLRGQPRIGAVLDWEMATLGDPLADLGMLLLYWCPDDVPPVIDIQKVTQHDGFWSADQVADEYARISGTPLHDLDAYVVFAHVKLAIIVEGIHARHLAGETVGDGYEALGATVQPLVERAMSIAAASRLPGLRL